MSTQKRFEIGVDYEGVSPRHLQVNEIVTFTNDKASRIFMPECGSFYVNSLVIKDSATGKDLVEGYDYDVFILDSKATKESGLQVCGLIVVKNDNVAGVLLNYQYVGGIHMTGYYIMEQLLKMYPEGSNAVMSFDEVLNKPDVYDPAHHTQHVSEIFKTTDLLVWLERTRQGVHQRQFKSLRQMYEQAQLSFTNLYDKLNQANSRLTADIQTVLNSISIQGDEYILTDSAENPAIRRGYGDWVMVTNTILRGGPSGNFLVGSGSLIAMGSEQVIRNCYIWYNKKDSVVNEAKVVLTSNKDILNEGESITFTLTTTNIPNGTKLEWFLEGIDETDISNNSAGIGTATVNSGKATVTLTAANDRKTEGNETYVFRLREFPTVSKNFTVVDTSKDRRVTSVSYMNTSNQKIETVGEDAKFKLRIVTTGLVGQTVYLRWSADAQYFASVPPTSVVITADTQDIPLETIGNLAVNDTRIVEVSVLETNNEVVDATTPKAILYILDTSQELLANVVFLNAANLIVTNIDEDSTFKIRVRTNGGIGQKLKLSYRSNRPMSEFTGLESEVTIGADNTATITAKNIANYLTATETEFLEVTVRAASDNRELTVGTLLLNDTTKNPNFIVSMSPTDDGSSVIKTINEGQDFYLVFKVPGWVGSTTPPLLDIVLTFTGSPSQAQRVTVPTKLTAIRFDEKNNTDRITWLNGDTLALRMSTIADKAIFGNAKLSVKWKMSLASVYVDGPSIDIIDTSKPTLTASWSSSATNLTPITSVDEMTTTGGDNVCHLWLQVDGDGSTYSNLKIDIDSTSSAKAADLVTVFPQNISIPKGTSNHIIRVTIAADFLTEGAETLKLKVTADGYSAPLVSPTITINDNSVQVPITYTRPASTIQSGGKYSEWEDVNITINLQPLAFATTLEITTTNADKVDGLTAGTYNIPANQSTYTIKMSAKKIRHENGDYAVTISAKRMFGTKVISNTASLTTNFVNDRLPPAINYLKIYESNGTTEATKLSEGKSYKIKVGVLRPMAGMLIAIGNTLATAADNTATPPKAGSRRFTFADNRKVVYKAGSESRTAVATGLIDISLPYDRLTNPVGLFFELAAKIDWSATNSSLVVGSSYTTSLTANTPEQRSTTITKPIEDISKSMRVDGYPSKTLGGAAEYIFDEGDNIFFNFDLQDATIGDEYEVIIGTGNTVATNRYSSHPFSSVTKKITLVSGTTNLVFQGKFLENWTTNTGDNGKVTLRNKTTGQNIFDIGFTLNDTTKTVTLAARWTNASGTKITSANEGTEFRLEVTAANLPSEYPIRLTNPVGRALTEFDYAEVNTNLYPANNKVIFRFGLKENFKVDTANTFGVTAEVVGLPVTVNLVVPPLTLNDTSKTKKLEAWWGTNTVVYDSATEGQQITLHVLTRGYPVNSAVNVELRGTGIDVADFTDGTLVKNGVLQASPNGDASCTFTWTLKNDLKTEGNETITATVTLVSSGDRTFANLTIVDTSLTPTVYNAYFTSDPKGNNRISTANEGDTVYAVLEAANVVNSFETTWQTFGNTGGSTSDGPYQTFENLTGTVTVKDGKNIVALKIPINYVTTGSLIAQIGFWIGSPVNAQIMTPNLTINDVYKTPSFRGVVWSRNAEGTDPVTTLNPGEIIYLVILTQNILPDQAFELSYPRMDGLTLSDFEYGPHSGTVQTKLDTYIASNRTGKKVIPFKVKAG